MKNIKEKLLNRRDFLKNASQGATALTNIGVIKACSSGKESDKTDTKQCEQRLILKILRSC